MWSIRRLNDMDPCPWSATRPLPTWRDTRAAGDPHFRDQHGGHPGAEACRRRLRLIASLGISLPCKGDAGWPGDGLNRGLPQLAVIALIVTARGQHHSGCSARLKRGQDRAACRVGGLVLKRARSRVEVEPPTAERPSPPRLVRLPSRADGRGTRKPGDAPLSCPVVGHPRVRPAGGVVDLESRLCSRARCSGLRASGIAFC
jgi:hypothetical protein